MWSAIVAAVAALLYALGLLTMPEPVAPSVAAPTSASACADRIANELSAAGVIVAEAANGPEVAAVTWPDLAADCIALGSDAAYVRHVGPTLPPCVFEDGSGGPMPCYWDAATRGNGLGASYIAVE